MIKKSEKGFTLLEIVVVLFIIGIIAGIAVISAFNDKHNRCYDDVKNFFSVLKLLNEEAVLKSENFAVSITDNGYISLKYDGKEWSEIEKNSFFEKPQIEFILDGRLVLIEDFGLDEESEDIIPHIIFLSIGEITPFKLTLFWREYDKKYEITSSLSGTLELLSL